MNIPQMPQPTFYLFKCEQSSPPNFPKPSCVNAESADLFNYMASKLMQNSIMGPVQPIRTSCLGRCQMGPVMMVEPGHFMYARLTKEKIDKIIDQHILNGTPVEEFLIEDQFWGEPLKIGNN